MLHIHHCHIIVSAAGSPQDSTTDARDCDGVSGQSVPASSKAWSDSSRDGEGDRHSSDTDVEPGAQRRTDTRGQKIQQAGTGKQAARRALVFVAEDVTATRYLDTYFYLYCAGGSRGDNRQNTAHDCSQRSATEHQKNNWGGGQSFVGGGVLLMRCHMVYSDTRLFSHDML